jgi:hypothetical protein
VRTKSHKNLETGVPGYYLHITIVAAILETEKMQREVAEVPQKMETTSESIGLVSKKAQAGI